MPDVRNYHGVLQPAGFPPLPENWISELETHPSSDGALRIFSATYRRKDLDSLTRPARALVISHGIGEHGGRYLHFPHFLEPEIDVLFCPDHRGHGRSEGLRGHVERFNQYSKDLHHGIRQLEDKLKTLERPYEIHVLGHSLGSLILLNLLVDHPELPLRSATLSSPMLGVAVKVPLAKKAAASTLSRLWGNLQMSTQMNASLLSHDPAVVDAYRKDRLVHDLCTPRLYTEMMGSMKKMAQQAGKVGFPLLLQIPMADKITNPEAAMAFFKALQESRGGDKKSLQLKTYPGFFHESYNETGKKQPFEDLKAWIIQHSSLSSGN